MKVRLTHYQARTVMTRVPQHLTVALDLNRTVAGPKAHDYELEPVLWREIRDHLLATCYGPQGGKLDAFPKALYRAVQLIHMEIMRVEKHPAMFLRGRIGFDTESLVAYPVRDGARYYSPYPPPSDLMPPNPVRLVPRHMTARGIDMTIWREEVV